MDRLHHARQLLSAEILNNFIGRITGAGIERIVGQNPENELLVGKLMSIKDSDGGINESKNYIESIGVDFYITSSQVESAHVTVIPQGDFYYRVIPSLEEQRQSLLQEINAKPNFNYSDFNEVIVDYELDPEKFNKISTPLVPVYKKISLNSVNPQISFYIRDVLDDSKEYGYIGDTHILNSKLDTYIQELQNHVNSDSETMLRSITEPTTLSALLSEESYSTFLRKNANSKVESQHQNWQLYFDVEVKRINDRFLISISLVNDSTVAFSNAHRSRKKNKFTIETLFNSGIRVHLEEAEFIPIKLDFFKDDYKYDKNQFALSNNCSVEYLKGENSLQTNHLPLYKQYRLVTNDKLAVKFTDLIENPISTLEEIAHKMHLELNKWQRYRKEIEPSLSEDGKEQLLKEIYGFEDEIANFEFGIYILKNYPLVRKSFIQMNKTFKASARGFTTWRLFQIVFIVSIIPDIVACDPEIMTDEEKAETHLSSMSLLYFPTGGGKTEAFLGVLIFNLFFDRYRGKKGGVTSILRYPLRLLSVQQIQRLANVLAQAELLRRADPNIAETDQFSLGYFVGKDNTPNRLSEEHYKQFRSMIQEQRDEQKILDVCPFCGKPTVHLEANEELKRLVHYCDNPDCPSGRILPIYIVDNEIYRYLPSAIVSTVDKFALVGCNTNFRTILNGADHKCPIHGYTSKRKCLENSCDLEVSDFQPEDMYDPAPTLFIQDELHLLRESLGVYAAHYESFIEYYIKNYSKSKRDLKIIGATATISSYEQQVYHLYGRTPIRFPAESPFIDRNFYSQIDENDLQRQILGYAPYGKAIDNSVVFSLKYLREAVNDYYSNPEKILKIPGIGINSIEEAIEILKDYWIFLEYNNVKLDGSRVESGIKTPINEELAVEGITPFKIRSMTGDSSFQEVRNVLAEVEHNDDVYNGVNLITATNMISHGVDADKFNMMLFYGIPGNMAEYIQAYSRTGRKFTSIVIDLIRPSRETDQSYLKNFVSIHKYKDLLVESVPINRWATKAIENTLPGIFTALLLTVYDPELQYTAGSLFFMKNIRRAILDGQLNKDIVKEQLYSSYGCIENDGNDLDLGNQYRDKISKIIDDLFIQIKDRSWTNEQIFDGFKLMGYHIMTSLRDTDTSLFIDLE